MAGSARSPFWFSLSILGCYIFWLSAFSQAFHADHQIFLCLSLFRWSSTDLFRSIISILYIFPQYNIKLFFRKKLVRPTIFVGLHSIHHSHYHVMCYLVDSGFCGSVSSGKLSIFAESVWYYCYIWLHWSFLCSVPLSFVSKSFKSNFQGLWSVLDIVLNDISLKIGFLAFHSSHQWTYMLRVHINSRLFMSLGWSLCGIGFQQM